MAYFLYNVLLILASPIILLILLAKKRCRRGIPQRLGWYPRDRVDSTVTTATIWVHAVSLGEVVAAVPLVRNIHARYPDRRIIVTTVTETGREAVEQRLAGIAEHRYMPLDFPWVVAAVLRIFQPSLFLCVETELWPNLLRALARRGVPVLLVNGRLSSQSYRGYRFIRPLMQQMLASVTHCLMQSRRDAERITALGAPAERVICTGNIKFDQPLPHLQDTDADSLRALLLAGQEDLLVAGSTHPGEEDQVLACYQRVVQQHPTLVLLIAPRHIERVGQLEAAAKARGLIVVRRSVLATGVSVQGPRVVILDTRGELAAVYRDAVVAFVGGTLVPVGGHNLLEPAMWGKPVLFGPYTDHCADIADLLIRAGGGRRVQNGEDLATQVAVFLRDQTERERMGEAGRQVVLENRGALNRTMTVIERVLDSRPCASDRQAKTLTMNCMAEKS